jgi:serine protease Do
MAVPGAPVPQEVPSMKSSANVSNPIVAAVIGATSLALPAAALYFYQDTPAAAEPARIVLEPQAPVVSGLPDFRELVRRYGPAVVNISVRANQRTSGGSQGGPSLPPDHPLAPFFRGQPGPGGGQPMRGEGSGFIVESSGVILTNAHVVAGADRVRVKLSDRREFDAKVLGSDESSDVAVLKIEATGLPSVRLGDPARTEVGEWVVAIGAPFGLENTVTAGIVSAKSRNLPDETYVPFIQTDVAVNPGNSGGPLFNLRGEVVGINSQIYSRSGGYQGISFAIPIDVAMNVGRQLQSNGRVARGRLGVQIQQVDQALAQSFGLDAPRGALVASVEDGGPANAAGLEAGDVILSFNGRAIETADQLPAVVAANAPGSKVTLEVWRDSARRKLDVRLGEVEGAERVAGAPADAASGKLGLTLRPLSPAESREAKVPRGLLVEGAEGAAAEAGIQRGDIVLSADGKPLASIEDLRGAIARDEGSVALLVQRGEGRLFVPVELG